MMKMKSIILTLAIIVMAASTLCAQQVFKTTSESVIAYYEYLPPDYHHNSDKYPVVFFMHGVGEKGPDSNDPAVLGKYISKVAVHGPPKHVKAGTQFPFILISPQLKSNYGQWTSAYIMEVVNHAKSYLRIDEKRIYVTGLSLGGGGTWVTAQDRADFIAALAPVCGGYNSPSKAVNLASENLPVWAFHGDADGVVSYNKSVNMVNAINSSTPKPSPLAKLTIYPGVGHNAWDYAYKPDHSIHNPNVYDWMLAQRNLKNRGNALPSANAGSDVSKSLTSGPVVLNGSGTDSDGSVISFSWKQISGTALTLTNMNASALTVSNLKAGTYVFRLTVTDNSGNTDSDYVKLTVTESTSTTISASSAPVVKAGSDKLIKLPTSSTTISASVTDDKGIASLKWSKVSGPSCSMTGTSGSSLKLSNLVSGDYIFRIVATDTEGNMSSDDVRVVADVAPVVNAGSDVKLNLPVNKITLSATASDPDGTIVKYLWSKYSGPNLVAGTNNTTSFSVSNLVAGTYVFKFAATDNHGVVSFDYVTVTVAGSM